MALARIQTRIVNKLKALGRLTEDQATAIIEAPGEMSGEAMESDCP